MSQVRARVFEDEFGQAVQLPEGFRFDVEQVYIQHDPQRRTLTISDRPFGAAHVEEMSELFQRIDAGGGFEFEMDRDRREHAERDAL